MALSRRRHNIEIAALGDTKWAFISFIYILFVFFCLLSEGMPWKKIGKGEEETKEHYCGMDPDTAQEAPSASSDFMEVFKKLFKERTLLTKSIYVDVLFALLFLILAHCPMAKCIEAYGRGDIVPFDVENFGAWGDGKTDDTQAFAAAWAATCGEVIGLPTMIIPAEKVFLLSPIIFEGPCMSNNVLVQVEGTLVPPQSPSAWDDIDASLWLQFQSVDGLVFTGSGELNGRGLNWWKQSCRLNSTKGCTKLAPTIVKFVHCSDLVVSNLQFVNSPQTHVLIIDSQRVHITHLKITAPGTSPNTDGIHIHASQFIYIEDTMIGTGDDCISIGDRTSDIIITRVTCGPGHGISIGSLGKGGSNVSVERIYVSSVNLFNTTNGVRIKTWQGATGFARSILFERIIFNNVNYPIIIDQNYCAKGNDCTAKKNAVKISNVRYADCAGTAKTEIAINLNCSRTVACTDIELDNINIPTTYSGKATRSYCNNAHVTTSGYIYPQLCPALP